MSEQLSRVVWAAGWPVRMALVGILKLYRVTLSGMFGGRCRFYPSCSDYAAQAIDLHGPARGSLLAARRLCKCHPWHPGGLDPVPAPAKSSGHSLNS